MTTRDSHDYPSYPIHPHDLEHEESGYTRKRLPIPDLRFEQVYLRRIQHCIHIEPTRDMEEKGEEQPAEVDTEDTEYTTSTHVTPFINSSQKVVRVDWAGIVYITLRDQVLMPLLQGMLWGIVGTYYRPFVVYARGCLHGSPVPTHPVEGEGVGWLRSWLKRLGFRSITIGPPNL